MSMINTIEVPETEKIKDIRKAWLFAADIWRTAKIYDMYIPIPLVYYRDNCCSGLCDTINMMRQLEYDTWKKMHQQLEEYREANNMSAENHYWPRCEKGKVLDSSSKFSNLGSVPSAISSQNRIRRSKKCQLDYLSLKE